MKTLWNILLPLAVATATPVYAQSNACASRDIVVERLSERYGETRQFIGLSANNTMIEVFTSKETGTWTITVTTPNGLTCLLDSGQSFENLSEVLPPKGDG